MIIKHQIVDMYGKMAVQIYAFLTSALELGPSSTQDRSSQLTFSRRFGGPRSGVNSVEKRKKQLFLLGIEPQPTARHYTYWAVPVPILNYSSPIFSLFFI
jgi:hypothetical protein